MGTISQCPSVSPLSSLPMCLESIESVTSTYSHLEPAPTVCLSVYVHCLDIYPSTHHAQLGSDLIASMMSFSLFCLLVLPAVIEDIT